jgi:hypothetical protein
MLEKEIADNEVAGPSQLGSFDPTVESMTEHQCHRKKGVAHQTNGNARSADSAE